MGPLEPGAIGPTDPVAVTARRPADMTGPARLLPGPVVLVDGECNVCDRTVHALIDRSDGCELWFAALQGTTAAALAAEVPELRIDLRTVVVAEPDRATGGVRVQTRSDAILRAFELSGSVPRWARLARAVPRPVRDAVYRVVAGNRHRIGGRKDACRLPSAEERGRLLP